MWFEKYKGWTITKGDFGNFNAKCPKNLVTGSYMSLKEVKDNIDKLIYNNGNIYEKH